MEYIFLSGEVGWEITPQKLQEQFDELDGQDVTIYVNTVGGNAFDGIAMYDYLKLKQSQGFTITTVATGVTASAGTLIFLAGNKALRKAHETATFLIHKASNWGGGTDDDLQKQADELKALNEKLAIIYDNETELTKDEALEIMKADKSSDVNWLKEKGFVAEIITYEAVASIKRNSNPKNKNKMAEKKEQLSEETKSFIMQGFEKLTNLIKGKPQNKIIQDANGVEIDFYELEADADPKVGDKAKVDDKDANGEYVVPSGETYVFADGELTEIKPKEDDGTEDAEALKQEIADLKEQLATAQNAKAQVEQEAQAKLETVKTEFENFKGQIQSKFDFDEKKEIPQNTKEGEIRERKIFKRKRK